MPIAESLLPEFDHEMRLTRRVLERVPVEQGDFKPHERSFSMLQLATHVANLPLWGLITLTTDGLDVASPQPQPPLVKSTPELLAFFDGNVAKARPVLAGMSDEAFQARWTLRDGTREVFSMPKVTVFRSYVMNHVIHHRGQLTVYLRMQDVPVPGCYGPSADER